MRPESTRELVEPVSVAERAAHPQGKGDPPRTGMATWDWDIRANRVVWSAELYRIFGLEPGSLRTLSYRTFRSRVHEEDRAHIDEQLKKALDSGSTLRTELRVLRPCGEVRSVRVDGQTTMTNGRPTRMFGTVQDITRWKALEDRLEHQALYDALTQLPNRALFRDRLAHAISTTHRNRQPLAVLLIDLDGFNEINDTVGYDAGDLVLAEVAERIRSSVRPSDTAARLAGDEFAVLLPATDQRSGFEVAERISAAIRRPIDVGSRQIMPEASLGLADGREGMDGLEILRDADLALHAAKERGRGRIGVVRPEMHTRMLRRMELKHDIRSAVPRGELHLHYQPIVRASDRSVASVEALLRWRHPTLGAVSPGEFIPIAESTGQIVQLGRWALAEACRQARQWQGARPEGLPLAMSVNLSVRQLREPGFLADVKAILADTGLDPGLLILEVTESALVEDFHDVIRELQAIRDMGVRLAIDDFGTGYSSLSYLRRLPVHAVKIDRSFITGIASESREWAVVRSIMQLMDALELIPTAEGIETGTQLAHLRALGCDLFQGYHFCRPLPAEQLQQFLEGDRLARDAAAARPASV